MKITTIHSPWMNSLMLYPNLMIQLLARMMCTTKCLNTSLMMLCSLNILNNIWASGKFPTSWCTSTVIPVPKPGKDTSYLRMLDPIQNHALSLCLGAYRTSPASSLCVEANEPALYFRRKKTRVIHVCKINDSLTGGQLHYDWNKITVSLGWITFWRLRWLPRLPVTLQPWPFYSQRVPSCYSDRIQPLAVTTHSSISR